MVAGCRLLVVFIFVGLPNLWALTNLQFDPLGGERWDSDVLVEVVLLKKEQNLFGTLFGRGSSKNVHDLPLQAFLLVQSGSAMDLGWL